MACCANREYWHLCDVPKVESRSCDLGQAPFLQYYLFGLVSLAVNLHSQFEVCMGEGSEI